MSAFPKVVDISNRKAGKDFDDKLESRLCSVICRSLVLTLRWSCTGTVPLLTKLTPANHLIERTAILRDLKKQKEEVSIKIERFLLYLRLFCNWISRLYFFPVARKDPKVDSIGVSRRNHAQCLFVFSIPNVFKGKITKQVSAPSGNSRYVGKFRFAPLPFPLPHFRLFMFLLYYWNVLTNNFIRQPCHYYSFKRFEKWSFEFCGKRRVASFSLPTSLRDLTHCWSYDE